MESIDTKKIKQKLQLQRQEILRLLRQIDKETQSLDFDANHDSADQCTTNLSKETLLERSSRNRILLRFVDAAIHRITEGSFGICVGCSNNIAPRRLQALPWTQYCLRCQEGNENKMGHGLSRRHPAGDDSISSHAV